MPIFILKNSLTPGNVPDPTDLMVGEVALNIPDKKIFTKDDNNQIVDFLAGVDYTETDPVFTDSVAYDITQQDVDNWNDAFGWGDHAQAGYVESVTGTSGEITITGTTDPVLSLEATGVTAGTYGSDTQVAQNTVDAKGRITEVVEVDISGLGGTNIPAGNPGEMLTYNNANTLVWIIPDGGYF